MAEWEKVTYEWKRMCDTFFVGKDWKCKKSCPMYELKICSDYKALHPYPLEFDEKSVKKYAEVIMKWAKENPEPVYPTWNEWLCEEGLMFSNGTSRIYLYDLGNSPIPPKTAIKLGLKPKILFPEEIKTNKEKGGE